MSLSVFVWTMKKHLLQENILAAAVILGSLAYLLSISWLKWGDLIIDTGREMSVPYVLSQGKLLYKDITYIYGPLTPYLHALIFRLWGAHLNLLIAGGIVTTFLTAFLTYKISRLFLNVLSSILAALTFLFVFAFGRYMYLANYNFILPYSYAATQGILFALAALYLFMRFLLYQKRSLLWGYSIFTAFTLLCRIELGLALLASLLLGLVVCRLKQTQTVSRRTILLSLGGPLAAAGAGFIPLAIMTGSWQVIKHNLIDIVYMNLNQRNVFVESLCGYDAWQQNLRLVCKSFLGYLVITAAFFLSSFLIGRIRRLKDLLNIRGIAGLILIVCALTWAKTFYPYWLQYRAVPLICILVGGYCLAGLLVVKKTSDLAKDVSLLALCVFSLLLTLRIILKVSAAHYGFYLLAPGMILYHIFFLRILPGLLNNKHKIFSAAFIALFVLLIINHFQIYRPVYAQQTLKVDGPRGGLFFMDTGTAGRCRELIEFLRQNTDQEDTLVVFPEGVALNFLSRRDNPLYYYQFLPYDLARPGVEQDIIAELRQKKVDYIAVLQRSTAEYGYPVFGAHYARELADWIAANYRVTQFFGPPPFSSAEFGIALLEKL